MTFGLRAFSAMATPASVPPVPTAQMKPSTLPSVCCQISGPVVSIWAWRLATLSNWLAQIAPFGRSSQLLGEAARQLHVIVRVGVGHRRHFDQLGAQASRSVSFFSWLCVSGITITVLKAERIADQRQPDAGIARGAFDDHAARPQLAL